MSPVAMLCAGVACGSSSDHEFKAWTGGSACGSGGNALCCMKPDHVDALRAEDEVAANSSDAEEPRSTRSGGDEAMLTASPGGCCGFACGSRSSDHDELRAEDEGGAAGGAEAPPVAAGGCGQDIGIVGHRSKSTAGAGTKFLSKSSYGGVGKW